MITDHPTTEIYFVFALTYCKVKVYTEDEAFAKNSFVPIQKLNCAI